MTQQPYPATGLTIAGVVFHADDLQTLAEHLRPHLAEAIESARWLTPEQFADAGYAPTADAARKRAKRGSVDWQPVGQRRILIRVPS